MNYAVAMRLAVLAVLSASWLTGCGGVQSRVQKGVVQTVIDQNPNRHAYIEEDSSLESRILATIKGAEILKSEFTSDNGCVVTMRLPKSRLQGMMGVAFK